jgi:hypothetical protein
MDEITDVLENAECGSTKASKENDTARKEFQMWQELIVSFAAMYFAQLLNEF